MGQDIESLMDVFENERRIEFIGCIYSRQRLAFVDPSFSAANTILW